MLCVMLKSIPYVRVPDVLSPGEVFIVAGVLITELLAKKQPHISVPTPTGV